MLIRGDAKTAGQDRSAPLWFFCFY